MEFSGVAFLPQISLQNTTSKGIIPQQFALKKQNCESSVAVYIWQYLWEHIRSRRRVSGGVEHLPANKYQTWLCNIVAYLYSFLNYYNCFCFAGGKSKSCLAGCELKDFTGAGLPCIRLHFPPSSPLPLFPFVPLPNPHKSKPGASTSAPRPPSSFPLKGVTNISSG